MPKIAKKDMPDAIFEQKIEPICIKNGFTLHECFKYLQENDTRLYQFLSDFWHTPFGRAYLRSKFRGGHIHP